MKGEIRRLSQNRIGPGRDMINSNQGTRIRKQGFHPPTSPEGRGGRRGSPNEKNDRHSRQQGGGKAKSLLAKGTRLWVLGEEGQRRRGKVWGGRGYKGIEERFSLRRAERRALGPGKTDERRRALLPRVKQMPAEILARTIIRG